MKRLNHKILNYTYITILFLVLISMTGFSLENPAKKDITFESLYSFETAGGLQLSPDGKRLLFTSRKADPETGGSRSTIRLMDTDGKNKQILTMKGKSAWSLRWIDGGKRIAFLSSVNKNVQVFTYQLETKEVKQITDYPTGVSDYVWSPTNDGLAFVSSVYPENASPEYFIERKKKEAAVKHSGKLYDKLLYRPYSRWDDGTITHVFYMDLKTGNVTDVTPGPHYAPTSHLGGRSDIAFSADGKTIAFTMNTDPVKAVSTNNDVFTVDVPVNGKSANPLQSRKKISTGNGCDVDPRFSTDGKYMLYSRMAREKYEADQKEIILIDLKNGNRRNMTKDLDRTLSSFFWSNNSKYIYLTCGDKGYTSLYRIETLTGKMTKLLGGVYFHSVNVDPEDRNLYLMKGSPAEPAEIFRYNLKSKSFTRLTDYSDIFVNNYKLGKTEVFWYKGAYGDPVQGFITFPAEYDKSNPTKKYPMIMNFHGGPEGAWNANFSNYGGNVHLFAAHGYIVVKINVHGSSSYGIKFQEAILKNWGVVDIEDVMTGLDYLLKTYPAIDAGKVAAMGRSYGGFMVNMLNGRTDRFKCFISVDGIFDQVSSYYATDELWFMETEFGGTPEESPEIYKRSSPATYSANFKTPALIIHGGRDYRVDPSQGFGMYTALQRKGIPSQLLFFPDEPHYFRKLQTWKYAYEVQFKWLKRWLK
jgi:dipeptidyl aminopeptidase/acylaminoacyl peptidase